MEVPLILGDDWEEFLCWREAYQHFNNCSLSPQSTMSAKAKFPCSFSSMLSLMAPDFHHIDNYALYSAKISYTVALMPTVIDAFI